jgi:hypothetical protein
MTTLIAPCGLDCGKCDAYVATQANDTVALERIAEKWRVEYHSPEIIVANLLCDGCMVGGRTIGYCQECKIRACAEAHGVENCATCPDYTCETLVNFHAQAPQAKANLEALR